MNRGIEIGKTILLTSKSQNLTVTIKKPIGHGGGSCIAYYVTYNETDNVTHLAVLKEFCPLYLGTERQLFRDNDENLIIPESLCDEFNNGLQNFIETYKKINDYLLNNFSASNSHPTQIGLFFANNTAYTLTAADYGESYDKIQNHNLLADLKIALAVAKAVEMYHSAGYLHLDIKPQNVLILDGVKDLIKLFDYDSLVDIEQVKNGYHVPDTGLYYVPEIQSHNFRRIGKHTDIFEIASMLYHKIFGLVPIREQMTADYHYDFENVQWLKGFSPKALFELEVLFKKTLQISYSQRYQTAEEFKSQLEKIISLVDSKVPHLINLPKWQPSCFSLGREQELSDVHSLLQKNGFVMIKAMGGMGKSEIAKMYAEQYGNEYHTVQFCKYTGSLKSLVSAIAIKGINDSEYENLDKLAKVKNNILHDCDNHTLIIIDNFNVTYDEFLRDFLPADNNGFKVIFTTRCEPAQDYLANKVYELTTLPKELCQQLFYFHSKLKITEERSMQIDKLLSIIDCNTLVLVLLAKSVKATKTKLEEVLRQLEQSKLEDVSGTVFHEYDYSSIDGDNYNKVFAHLNTIFSIARLTSVQKELLLCLSLVSNIGIETNEFISNCDNSAFTEKEIADLATCGWIEQDRENRISLHPVVSDLVFANRSIAKGKSYDNLSYCIIHQCNSFGAEHIDAMNVMFSYLYHLDKRLGNEIEFRSIDVKLYLAKLYFNLFMPKEANQKLNDAEGIISHSFRYKPRLCELYFLKGEIENEFGKSENAIEFYNIAITYCKRTVNFYYDARLRSLVGIAECYTKLHNFDKAYKTYIEAYNYVYNDSKKEKINGKIFITNKLGTKNLYHYVPSICDGIIEVCKELQLVNEIDKYKKIKSEFETNDNEWQMVADKAQKLFYKGDIKGGTRIFFEALEEAKEEYGEDSPIYKKLEANLKPLLVMSFAEDENISVHPISEGIEYIKEKYGEKSEEYLDYIDIILNVLLEIGELEFAKSLALQCKTTAKEIFSENSYAYQSFNLHLVCISQLLGDNISSKNALNDIDYSWFQSKSELESLVKRAGIALYNFGAVDIAQKVAGKVYNLKNPELSSLYMACIILCWISIDKNDLDKAKSYLNHGKSVINEFKEGFLKDEWLYMYYYALSKYHSELNDEEKAAEVWQHYIDKVDKQTSYSTLLLKCRAFCERSIHFRYIQKYREAYESVKLAKTLLEYNSVLNSGFIRRVVYGNYAICSMYCQKYNDAHEFIEKYMNLFSDEQKITDKDYITTILFFIDALIISQDKRFYYFIEESEKVVERGNFYNDFENAMLKNYIGVVLCDYEEKYGLAKNYFNEAKDILDALNMKTHKLYEQILANIEYADKKNWDSLIGGLVSAYSDDKNEVEE